MADGAGLEYRFAGNRIEGSNPSASAVRRPDPVTRVKAGLAAVALVAVAVSGWPAARASRMGARVAWRISALPRALGAEAASFGEPGIAVGARGRLLVNAAPANAGRPTWWLSTDNGAHWGPGLDLDPSGAMTGDADGAFGSDGFVYVLNLASKSPPAQPSNPTIFVYASANGRPFQGPAAFPVPHGLDQPDRPWLVVDPYRPSRILVTNSEGAGDVVAWASSDHAHSFTGPVLVTSLRHAASIELTSRPLFDTTRRDRVFMLYEASALTSISAVDPRAPLRDFPLSQLWLARSDDGGKTWSNTLVLDTVGTFGPRGGSLGHVLPAFAIDRQGTLYAAFSLRLATSTQTHLFLIRSTDHGVHWSRPIRIDRGYSASNVMPALAAGTGGRLDVSWYGSTSPDFTDPHARWVEMFAQSVNALSGNPTFASGIVGGVTHIGSIDASGNPGSNLYDWGLRDFQSIVLDSCGMAHLAWTDDTRAGATMVARQVSGPSLVPGARCP